MRIESIYCACGCGVALNRFDKWNRPRRFISGHNSLGQPAYKKAGPIAPRFWSHVDKSGECWLWTAYRNPLGYGQSYMPGRGRGRIKAHRMAWELTYGSPGNAHVLHKCDNPPCVRPDHLYLGTHADNMADMARRGRRLGKTAVRGADNPKSRLTEDLVRSIRARATEGLTYTALGREFGLDKGHVWAIVKRRLWRHVA